MNNFIAPKFGILVATKDRPEQLEIFLQSVTSLSIQPDEVVISSSGLEIEALIYKFNKKLKLHHVHSIESGQVMQKKRGLSYFSEKIQWIAFFDDDLVLFPDSIENIFNDINELSKTFTVAGVGFADANYQKQQKNKLQILRKIFFSSNINLGEVNRSGYNVSYQGSNKVIETQWLNGASIWMSKIARKYNVPFEHVSHAIGEDLIFSYNARKDGLLFFSPGSKFAFQKSIARKIEINDYIVHHYIQLYFVLSHKSLSKLAFYWRFLGSSFFAMIRNNFIASNIFLILKKIINALLDILWLIISRKTPEYVLAKRINF